MTDPKFIPDALQNSLPCLLVLLLFVAACQPAQPTTFADLPSMPGWKLVFSDEFEGDKLNEAKWNTCYPWVEADGGCTNSGNHELEWYQPDEVFVENSLLRLRAQRRSLKTGFPYTSGMVTTHGKFAFQYGYIEARLKVPAGKGMWPALWILPEDGHWPPEVDVLEILGHDTKQVYTTQHYTLQGSDHQSRGSSYSGPDFAADFHTFALLWEPRALTWYVDGVERFFVEENIPDEPFYLLANLAVGGDWPGSPDEATPFPGFYEIDYIRIFQNIAYDATAAVPTPTPSGGKNILHAAQILTRDKDGKATHQFAPGWVLWKVQVVNQDGTPVRNASVNMSLLDKDGNEVKKLFSWGKTNRFGWAEFSTMIEEPGQYRLRVDKITLISMSASYDPSSDVKPEKITVK